MPKQITMVRWSATNVPYGVAFDENTGIFSGTPANAGDYVVPVTVETNYGKDTKDVALNIEDLKNQWREFTVDTGIALQDCVDNGQEIIFFGKNSSYKGGIFFTYKPSDNTYSDIYKLIDGAKYSNETDGTSYNFKSCVQDPVSKKWLAFFGKNYIRTPSGVKDLGSDVDFTCIATCWANSLQKFCVIGQSSGGELTSYLFDVDGNLLDKSSSINLVSNFKLYSTSNTNRSRDSVLCWSDKENKFVAISNSSNVIAYSSDGLNWNRTTISGVTLLDTGRVIYRLEELGLFILSSGRITLSGNQGIASSSIYTSQDGITWTKIKSLTNLMPTKIAWSESKQILCMVGYYKGSYITKDFTEWELINTENTTLDFTGELIWSDTANAFISPQGNTNKFLRLKI